MFDLTSCSDNMKLHHQHAKNTKLNGWMESLQNMRWMHISKKAARLAPNSLRIGMLTVSTMLAENVTANHVAANHVAANHVAANHVAANPLSHVAANH